MATRSSNGPRSIEALATQVGALEGDYQRIDNAVGVLNAKIDSGFSRIQSQFDAAITAIQVKIDNQARPNWALVVSTVSLGVLILSLLGAFAYWPLSTVGADNKRSLELLQMASITHREFDLERDRTAKILETLVPTRAFEAARNRLDNDIREVRARQVTRDEHQREWHSFEVQHQDLKDRLTREVATIQRELDELQKSSNNTYNVRDVLGDLKRNQDEIWRMLRKEPH